MNENQTMHLGPDGKLVPAPPLNTCQVCGDSIAPEADGQDICPDCRCCDAEDILIVDPHPCAEPIPADLLPPQTRIANVRIACEAPHVSTGDGGDAPDMQDYARRDRIRALAEKLFVEAFTAWAAQEPNPRVISWRPTAGVCLEAATAFEEVTRG